jgi:hypothetical protein
MTVEQAIYWANDAIVKAVTFDWLQMTIVQFLLVFAGWSFGTFWEPYSEYKKAVKKAEEAGELVSAYHLIGFSVCLIIWFAPVFWFFWINR